MNFDFFSLSELESGSEMRAKVASLKVWKEHKKLRDFSKTYRLKINRMITKDLFKEAEALLLDLRDITFYPQRANQIFLKGQIMINEFLGRSQRYSPQIAAEINTMKTALEQAVERIRHKATLLH